MAIGDYYRLECSAAASPFLCHTVFSPVSGPASARSKVAVSLLKAQELGLNPGDITTLEE